MISRKMTRTNDQRVFAENCLKADSVLERFRGLMMKDSLATGDGLLLEPCNSIHTFFMRFDIDVVYLSKEAGSGGAGIYKVVKVCPEVRPWRMHLPVIGARAVLELAKGGASGLQKGDVLCLS